MEKISRMWKISSGDDSPASKRRERNKPGNVDEIRDDQPENPYTEIQLLMHHTDIVRHLLKVGDHFCLTAGDDGTAVLWDVRLGRKLQVLSGHTRPITCALLMSRTATCHDNSLLLTGSSDRQIRIWSINTGESLHLMTEHQSFVKCLVAVKNETYIISGGEKICIWSRNGQLLNSLSLDSEDGSVALMIAIKNDRIVVALDRQMIVYQLTEEDIDPDKPGPGIFPCTKLLPHRETIKCLVNIGSAAFASGSLDGTLVLWGSHTLSRCRTFNSRTDYQDSQKSYPYSVQYVFSLEDHYIYAAVGASFHVYDLSGQILAEKTNAHYSKIIHMTFVYNGAFLATCSEDGSIRLWGSNRCVRRKDKMGITERFLGLAREDFSLRGDCPPVEPLLIGECLGHSGAVLNLVDFGAEGFVSCGMDKLAILWRDGVVQSLKRTEIARDLVLGDDVPL